MWLEGRHALVTGGGSGIGRATAMRLVREGATVTIAERNAETGAQVAAAIEDMGGSAEFVQVDVAQEQEVVEAIQSVVKRHGRLDVMVNNAGIGAGAEGWDTTISVNLSGVLYGCTHAIAQMREQGDGGAIVSVASIAGLVGGFGTAYVASKHGVIGLTRDLALATAADGIRINCVCPGYIRTALTQAMWEREQSDAHIADMVPAKRWGEPEEIANAVVWLASPEASYVTGTALVVDGGFTAR